MSEVSFTEGGLVFGEAIGKTLDEVGFETSDVTKSRLDERLQVGRLERDEVRAEVHFDPGSRRIYSIRIEWPQEHEHDGVQRQLARAQAVSGALRERLGEGKQTLTNKKKNARRDWERDGARITFSFRQNSNFAGYYADLDVTSQSTGSVDELLGSG